MRVPPVRDIDPAGKQHLPLAERIFDELAQRIDAAGLGDKAWMPADRQSSRVGFPLTPQLVEAALEIIEKVPWPTVSRQQAELAIVVGEGIRDNEVRLAKDL